MKNFFQISITWWVDWVAAKHREETQCPFYKNLVKIFIRHLMVAISLKYHQYMSNYVHQIVSAVDSRTCTRSRTVYVPQTLANITTKNNNLLENKDELFTRTLFLMNLYARQVPVPLFLFTLRKRHTQFENKSVPFTFQ